MPKKRQRRNPLPAAPPKRRFAGQPTSKQVSSSLARVRKLARDLPENERSFDPSRAPSWRGSSRDLVVNGRMDAFTRGFLETALWSSSDESTDAGGDPLDQNYSIDDFDPKSLEGLAADCARFQEENADDLAACYEAGIRGSEAGDEFSAGHDFWLTRCGHGAGFWDGDYPEPQATRLTEASKAFGNVDLYVGDDGVIYAAGYEPPLIPNARRMRKNSYELSFSPEFFFAEGEPYDGGPELPARRPISVWSAVETMRLSDPARWAELAKEVFSLDNPSYLTPESVLEKIQETNTCGTLSSPVDVYIDPEGYFTVDVYDEHRQNGRRPAHRRNAEQTHFPFGSKYAGPIEIPMVEFDWEQIDGDVNLGSYGGIIARCDGDQIDLVEIQPVREYVGDGEAAEVGFPFWTKEASYDLDDLSPRNEQVQSALQSSDVDLEEIEPEWRARAIALACMRYGHGSEEGDGGWAGDKQPGEGGRGNLLGSRKVRWSYAGTKRETFAEAYDGEDDEFRREVLGEEDEED